MDFAFLYWQINSRSPGSGCIKGTEEPSPRVDSSVSLTHHDSKLRSWIDLSSNETQNPHFGFLWI